MSPWTLTPSQMRCRNRVSTGSEHLPLSQRPLSHSSLLSHSSPPAFLLAAHLPSEHAPETHSSSDWQLSPASFASAHFPSTHERLLHCASFAHSAPASFLVLAVLHPGKLGGHSDPDTSAHWLGGD